MEIKELIQESYSNAKKHGFWEDFDNQGFSKDIKISKNYFEDDQQIFNSMVSSRLMLIVSELAEAQEGLRHNDVDNFKEELADTAIRLADLCGGLGIDLEAEIIKKMKINEKRGYLHGKAF